MPERQAFTVRLDAAPYEQLRERAYRNHTAIQNLAEQAILAWLSGEQTSLGTLRRDEQKQLELFLDLLRNGPQEVKRVAVAMLSLWEKQRSAS